MTTAQVEAPRESIATAATQSERTTAPGTREVRHEYTHTLAALLNQLGISLLVSTYQAGKVVAIGVTQGQVRLSYHNFERAMGLAVKPDGIAVGARAQVWFLKSAPDLAPRVEPAGRHDACFLTRSSHFTGEVQAHELAWTSSPLSPPAVGAVGAERQEKYPPVRLSSPDLQESAGTLVGAASRAAPEAPAVRFGSPDLPPRGRGAAPLPPLSPLPRGVGGEGELWLVNTAFSCLCTLDMQHSFVPRWRPPFISALAAEDRCHLNGLALADGQPKYVTALAETDTPQGWRTDKARSGCLIDVPSGQTVARGFAMPHSPRVHHGRVWMLHSGAGQLVLIDRASGKAETVTELPGYTRGLALHDRFAFVGLSKIRETSTFGGMPIAERRPELKCGVGVVDLHTGRLVAHLEFVTGVEEIFDVQVLPGARCPLLSGPYPTLDGTGPVWTVPLPPPPVKGS